jgi:hypothetical protein
MQPKQPYNNNISNLFIWACIISSCGKDVKNETGCRFEGAECPNAQEHLQDYQIRLHMDTVWVYDYDRLVGTFINTKWDSQLDSIILKDNL